MKIGKFFVATALSAAMVISPAVAQVAPYNPTIRAAPPKFVPHQQQETETEARNRKLGTALAWGTVAFLLWMATRSRSSAQDDQPTWTTRQKDETIWLPEQARPTVEPPAPSAPAISPFYDTSRGVGE